MTEIVRFAGPEGASLLVEVDEDAPGLERISRDSAGVAEAGRRLEDALATARPAISAVVDSVKALAPDGFEVEFGVKLSAEAGVVVAKTAVEGHFTVKVHWSRTSPDSRA
ncbi:CU044_2847 family protein [Streptomyces sp. NPDC059176]|uniref:CU044_2847 family protein n=1 Tax=unclassified Streptomyces TaxID=2593676 RepID=UPI0036B4B08A